MKQTKEEYGSYTKSVVSDIPADTTSEEYLFYQKTIPQFEGEAVYIYSFLQNKMIYAKGWHNVLGYSDDEISMLKIVSITSPQYAMFSNAINDVALRFINSKTQSLEKYSFSIELQKTHANGTLVPLISRVGVFKAQEGKVTHIIGRSQVNHGLKFGRVMRYEAFGPLKEEFEAELSKSLFKHLSISNKELEALQMVAQGKSFRQIAEELSVSHSAIEKRILPLYKRFEVNSLSHLVSFAYENHLI